MATTLSELSTLLALPLLPPAAEYSREDDTPLLGAVVAKLLVALASDDPRTWCSSNNVSLLLGVLVALRRHRAITPMEARVVALRATMEETGCDALLTRLGDLKRAVAYDTNNEVDMRFTVAFTTVYMTCIQLWNWAVPGKRHPNVLNGWQIIPGTSDDDVRRWLVETMWPKCFEIATNRVEDPVLRAGSLVHTSMAMFDMFQSSKDVHTVNVYSEECAAAAVGLVAELRPPPTDGAPDDLALASADVDMILANVLQYFVGHASAMNWSGVPPEVGRTFATRTISAGVPALCYRMLESFRTLPGGAETAHEDTAAAATILQMLAQPDGECSQLVLQSIEASGTQPFALQQALLCAIETGQNLVAHATSNARLELKAAGALAHLFGRQEMDNDSGSASPFGKRVAVPSSVIHDLVALVHGQLAGTKDGNISAQCDALFALSVSDANTAAMADAGVLDTIALALSQGKDIIEARDSFLQYPIPKAREACARVLLNLSLSEKTVCAVSQHTSLHKAIEAAIADADNLTRKAGKLLSDVQFQLKLMADASLAAERVKAAQAQTSVDDRHLMISYDPAVPILRCVAIVAFFLPGCTYIVCRYCWAQQDLILRIRKALGERGYKVWLGEPCVLR